MGRNVHERLERLEALEGATQAIEGIRLATEALAYIAEANTLEAAKSTARAALFGIAKELRRERGSDAGCA